MRHRSTFLLVLALSVVSILSSGCNKNPEVRKQKYVESGDRYFEKAKYREAAIQYSNAIQVDSRYADAHYKLAQTQLKLQQWLAAYRELGRTLELQPENYPAHIDIANLLISGHDLKQAQEHTDLVLSRQPNNALVHVAVANLLSAQGDLNGATTEIQKAITLDPNRSESYVDFALLQLRSNQPDGAEASFKKAIELAPKALNPLLSLGGFYQSRGRMPESEEKYKEAIALEPKSVEPRAALARLYIVEARKDDAEALLKQSKKDLADNSVGYRLLGDFYFAMGDLDKSVNEYASLYQDHPKDLLVKKNYIQILILKGRVDEARKLNDEILKQNGKDTEALIYKGEIQIRDGHANDAVDTLQAALKNEPDNGVAHYQLGIAFDQVGNIAQAESEWRDAVRIAPNLVEAQRALASVALSRNDMAALDQSATQVVALQPTSPDGYALLAVSAMNQKQYAKAEQLVQKAVEVAPKSAVGYIQLGNLKFLQKQFPDAEKAYQQALENDPASADALSGLMNIYISQKQVDKAIAVANAQITKAPNSSPFYDLLGTLLFNNKKDLNGAEAALKKSADLDKSNSDALVKLGQVQIAKGSVDQAISTYQNSIKDNPREPSFYILMGELYESKQDWNKAKEAYQKALEIRPDNALASNNLAYVMLETGGNVDVALSLAQVGRRGMPDSPNAADTLGWVYFQKGAYRSAIDLFQEAIKLTEKNKVADDATFHYHLGLAYQKDNQPGLARQHLERVLKLNPNYTSASDVKKALSQLKS
jgi:tetratricopeptide (TPR) repeat protein